MYSIFEQARKIKLLIMDVDGVMTDDCIYYNADGEVNKSFNAQDGLGLRRLHSTAVQLAIIADHCVEQRARTMHIDYYSSGVTDKKLGLAELLGRVYLTCEACVVISDDLIDLPIMIWVRLAAAVPEAPAMLRKHAHYVTDGSGGKGAVREVTELIMQAKGSSGQILKKSLA